MKRIVILALMALAVSTLTLSLMPRVAAQNEERRQTLNVYYPSTGIVLSGKGDDAIIYRGTVHIQLFPISPQLRKKYGDDAFASEDAICGDRLDFSQPLGKYELHFSMRDGNEAKTTIETVVLRTDGISHVQIDFSDAKTLIIGGDHTLQQMEAAIGELAQQVLALQAEVDALKGKAVTPAPAPTETPAK